MFKKLMILLMICLFAPSVMALSWSDFTYFDRVLMGEAFSMDETNTYVSTNLLTYSGNAMDGQLKLIELSLNIGLLDYESIDLDGDGWEDTIKPIVDASLNVVELGKQILVIDYVARLIPSWVHVGAGISAAYINDDVEYNGKFVGAIKIDL